MNRRAFVAALVAVLAAPQGAFVSRDEKARIADLRTRGHADDEGTRTEEG